MKYINLHSTETALLCVQNDLLQAVGTHGGAILVGLRPVIQILCHVLAQGWGRWLRYFTEAKAEVKYCASARIRGPKHDTRFEWPVSILIMTRHPLLPFKTHKTSAKNPRLLTITGAIWLCRYRQCTPSQLWMHAPVAKERRLMTATPKFFAHRLWSFSATFHIDNGQKLHKVKQTMLVSHTKCV